MFSLSPYQGHNRLVFTHNQSTQYEYDGDLISVSLSEPFVMEWAVGMWWKQESLLQLNWLDTSQNVHVWML